MKGPIQWMTENHVAANLLMDQLPFELALAEPQPQQFWVGSLYLPRGGTHFGSLPEARASVSKHQHLMNL